MKIITTSILLAVFMLSLNTYAGSGKAVLSHWGAASNVPTAIFVSNVTQNTIKVSITFYSKNGTEITPSAYFNFSNGNTELNAKSSGYVTIETGSLDYGFATIEWENLDGDDDTFALVAHGFRVIANSSSRRSDYSIQINNGQPF